MWRETRMQAIVLKHSLSLFQRCGWNRAAVGKTAPTRRILVTSQEDIDKYKTDTATLAKWLDFSVVKKKGRVYEPNTRLIEQTAAESFPTVPVYNLTGNDVVFPGYASDADVKLVAFSFKHYGFTLVRSWIDPYVEHFSANNNNGININSNPDTTKKNSKTSSKVVQQQAPKVVALEICFVEYGFLTLAKNVFTSNLRTSVSESQHANTGVAFGSIMVTDCILCLLCTCSI